MFIDYKILKLWAQIFYSLERKKFETFDSDIFALKR